MRPARTCLALSLWLVSSWILNATLYAGFDSVMPEARDIASAFAVVVALLATFAAVHRPDMFKERLFTPLCYGILLCGIALSLLGIGLKLPVLIVAGSAVRASSSIWFLLLVGLSLSTLSARSASVVVAGAYVLKYAWWFVSSMLAFEVLVAVYALIPLAIVLLVRRFTLPAFSEIADLGSRLVHQVTSPQSFLPFTHVLFITIVVFQAAAGYALAFGSQAGVPADSAYSFAPLLVVLLLALRKRRLPADWLFAAAAILVIAGFFFVEEVTFAPGMPRIPWANVLLNAGADCFEILIWFVLAQIVRRNVMEALPVLFFFSAATHLGIEIGATLGHATNALGWSFPAYVTLARLGIALMFIAYIIVVLKPFSFEATIEQVAPMNKPLVSLPARTLEENCEQVAAAYSLTPRESEVLGLLARGRNAQAIQEKLVVSRNTVKSHVKNVYNKLGVHSQQELIDLVESR
ncbi:transcriptional regulator MalT [Coriobacteriaceae bacterium CHKCI002]|nr:transcriptional regulator MalT [Coriobacteriaceae bacterium CHKCI002]